MTTNRNQLTMLDLQGYIVRLRSLLINTWREAAFQRMSLTLGEKLRAAREERGISISEVAEQTRIAPMYLECIEKNDYKPLPGGIFNKGFVKSYARYIGFDEHEALQDYTRLTAQHEAVEEEQFKTYRPEVLTDDRTRASFVPTIIFAGIILALMSGGLWFLVNYFQNQPSSPPAATNTVATNQAASQPDQNPAPPQSGSVPTMQTLKVEFRSATVPISLSATSDGKTSVNTITPGTSQTFEPRESLRLGYSKSLASSAQLFVNGKQIALPTVPMNPKRVAIEIEINKDNLAQIWETGQIQFGTAPANTPVDTPATSQTPAAANTASTPNSPPPTPSPRTSPAVTKPSPRPTQTPIVVGGNRNATRPTPN